MKPEQRDRIRKLAVGVLKALEPEGVNAKQWGDVLSGMDPNAFDKWIADFLKDDDKHFTLEVMPFRNEPKLEDVERAAKLLGLPLEERVTFRHQKGEPFQTQAKVPVGYIHVRRLQQILKKKNRFTTDISKRNPATGQVTGGSKIGRNSAAETNALITMEADRAWQELLGARAGGWGSKLALYNAINQDGFASLDEVQAAESVLDRKTTNMMDVYLTAAGLQTDLIADGNVMASRYLD